MYDFFTNTFIPDKSPTILDGLNAGTEIKKVVIPTFEITYTNSGFGVYVVEDEDENKFNIKGTFVAPLVPGQTYSLSGKVTEYKGEKQVSVDKIRNVKPISKKGIVAYLQTLRGLKSKAEWIFDEFGEECIDILMKDPMRVVKAVKGIGKKSVESWQEQLLKMQDTQEIFATLLGYGLSQKEAKKLYEKYQDDILVKLEENPYILSVEVKGYGFEKCDRIARHMGYDVKSPYRIQEGIIHVLKNSSNEGHCFLPGEELVERAMELLTVRLSLPEMQGFYRLHAGKETFEYLIGEKGYEVNYNEMVAQLNLRKRYILVPFETEELLKELEQLVVQRRLVLDEARAYLTQYYWAELEVARHVKAIASNDTPFVGNNVAKLVKKCQLRGIELEAMQEKAIVDFTSSQGGFHILNGSAGCGKTFSLNLVLEIYAEQFLNEYGVKPSIMVLAPTGKASKVAAKATQRDCMTVHRGLKYNPTCGFEFNEEEKLPVNLVVVDESSMLDIVLAKHLLEAIPKHAKVIFLGDTKQLPSVGAGNVLKDLIESGEVSVVTLTVIKRQGEKSGIIRNANRIIEGKMIENCEDTKDAFIIARETPKAALEAIVESIKRVQKAKGYSLEDIQVLCPQKNTMVGTEYTNYVLQQIFNPDTGGEKVLNKKVSVKLDPRDNRTTDIDLYFRAGDKVIHIKNNYDIPWMEQTPVGYRPLGDSVTGITNGECGVIEEIIKGKNSDGVTITQVVVKYEEGFIVYEDGVTELEHAYALTIHKSQGSQWKAVIIPMMKQNYMMLDNNLFYTAYTRAEAFSVVVGQPDAIRHAIKTHRTRTRYTSLAQRLTEAVAA